MNIRINFENGNILRSDWKNAPTYATLAKFEEEDEKDEEEPRKLELTKKDVETIKNGGMAPFTIKDLANASGQTVEQYAKTHGIPPKTAEGWQYGRPVKPFILAALYYWDKSAGIFEDKSQKD